MGRCQILEGIVCLSRWRFEFNPKNREVIKGSKKWSGLINYMYRTYSTLSYCVEDTLRRGSKLGAAEFPGWVDGVDGSGRGGWRRVAGPQEYLACGSNRTLWPIGRGWRRERSWGSDGPQGRFMSSSNHWVLLLGKGWWHFYPIVTVQNCSNICHVSLSPEHPCCLGLVRSCEFSGVRDLTCSGMRLSVQFRAAWPDQGAGVRWHIWPSYTLRCHPHALRILMGLLFF